MILEVRDHLLRTPAAKRALSGEEMLAFARSIDLGRLDCGPYRRFAPARYARNTVLLNEHVELVVICWLPGQSTAIHDHGKSHCLYLVVEGTMKEELFHVPPAGEPVRLRARTFARGDITLAGPKDVHRILNETAAELVTLHMYSPPLGESMRLYSPVPGGAAADPRS